MAKRTGELDEESPCKKRRKLTEDIGTKQPVQPFQTAKDLRSLLVFEQDTGPHARQRIQSFRSFLEQIAYGTESDDQAAKRETLLEYLQSQAPPSGEGDFTYLADIVKTWHFAARSNVEGLFSAVAAVLALLLGTISSLFEFRIWGNHLCRSLLQDDQMTLFNRGLTANKTKEHLISPCLRLLTEIVSFDGGHAASSVFRQRGTTFNRLEMFLGMRVGAHAQHRKTPSLRETALTFLYANLRLQNPAAKMTILSLGKVIHAWIEDITEDSPSVVFKTLEVLKKDIAMGAALTVTSKSRFFSEWVLGRLATLYSYDDAKNLAESQQSVQKSTHDLLQLVCTSPGLGVLELPNGSHGNVMSSDANLTNSSQRDIPPKADRIIRKNVKLASFLQTLRPHASLLQSDLIVAIFRNTPELVSDYFHKQHSLSFDPKVTATWIGYSSFMLATVQIPAPERLTLESVNGPMPSLYATFIESILPLPLNQKVMSRCLSQSSDLVKFLALRILTAAFEKLAKVLRVCKDIQYHTDGKYCALAWEQTALRLTTEFCNRIPNMEVVIAQFRSCPGENVILRESITRLLAHYYEVVPKLALEQKLDICVAFSAALEKGSSSAEGLEEDKIRLLELENLLFIAHQSPDMQWFHKAAAMWLSPFTMLLKMHRDRRRTNPDCNKFEHVLRQIATENHILHSQSALEMLTLSLQDWGGFIASNKVFEFLDSCILRFVRKSIYYYDGLMSLVAAATTDINSSNSHIDLLLVTIMEQWPFLTKSADPPTITNVSSWLLRYMEMARLDGADAKVLGKICDKIERELQDKACRDMFRKALTERPELELPGELPAYANSKGHNHVSRPNPHIAEVTPKSHTAILQPGPPKEDENHPGLYRWSRENIQDAIAGGATAELFLCLCSSYAEIRKQALHSIRTFMGELEASGYSEWQQTFVLSGELVETAEETVPKGPLPYFAAVLAAQLLSVLANPLHFLYEKANRFLNRGPQWNVKKLPSYWIDKVLLHPPIDDSHHLEVEWLLEILIDGLRTPADIELYRHSNIFERLLSLSASPLLTEPGSNKLMGLLFRCTYVGGSSTLITRCGIASWIASRLTSKNIDERERTTLEDLALRVHKTCDQERLNEWSNGALSATLESLRFTGSG